MRVGLQTLAFSVFALAMSVSGCKKQEQQEAPPIKPGDKYQLVDPFNDLVACLDGPHRILYVLPEQRENVLKLLHASGNGDRYILEAAMNFYRKEVPIGFQVKEASLNDLIGVSSYFDAIKASLLSHV